MQASTVYLGIYLFHRFSCVQAGITFSALGLYHTQHRTAVISHK